MKLRLITILSIFAMVFALVLPGSVMAASGPAYGTAFVTSITYQNVGAAADSNISINFYAQANGTAIPITRPTLAKGASTSLYIGSLSDPAIGAGFNGSAVMSSGEPLVATIIQVPQNNDVVKNRPLSNSFASGSATVRIPTVLKNTFSVNTIFTVQNADQVGADLTITFVDAANPLNTYTLTEPNLPAGSAKYYDMGTTIATTPAMPASLNSSVTIVAKKTGTSNDGSIVASVMELGINSSFVDAFEGFSTGASTVYMPSAQCNAFGANFITNYAVQNLGPDTTVTVLYSNGHSEGKAIASGAKASFGGCGATNPNGYTGSATLTATNPTDSIIAVGKVSGLGMSTAFSGASSGSRYIALPYVRWSASQYTTGARQQTNIAIQNIGPDLAAGTVVVKYVDKNGVVVGTHTLGAIPNKGKANSTPIAATPAQTEFGYYADGSFGGGAIIVGPAGAQLVAIARVQSLVLAVPAPSNIAAEDYNGTIIDTDPTLP